MKQKENEKKKVGVKTIEKKSRQQAYDFLDPEEEKVIRMRYGLSEPDSKEIEYALGASQDTRSRLALMEAGNIEELDGDVPISKDADASKLKAFIHSLS